MPTTFKKPVELKKDYPKLSRLLQIFFDEIVATPVDMMLIQSRIEEKMPSDILLSLTNEDDVRAKNYHYYYPETSLFKTALKIQARRSFFQNIIDSMGDDKLKKFEEYLESEYKQFKEKGLIRGAPTLYYQDIKEKNDPSGFLRVFAKPFIDEARNLANNVADKISYREMLGVALQAPSFSWSHSNKILLDKKIKFMIPFACLALIIFIPLFIYSCLSSAGETSDNLDDKTSISMTFSSAFCLILFGVFFGYGYSRLSKSMVHSKSFTPYNSKALLSTLGPTLGLKDKPLNLMLKSLFSDSVGLIDAFGLLTTRRGMPVEIANIIMDYSMNNYQKREMTFFKEIIKESNLNNQLSLKGNNNNDEYDDKNKDKDEKNDNGNDKKSSLEFLITEQISRNGIQITLSSDSLNEQNKDDVFVSYPGV